MKKEMWVVPSPSPAVDQTRSRTMPAWSDKLPRNVRSNDSRAAPTFVMRRCWILSSSSLEALGSERAHGPTGNDLVVHRLGLRFRSRVELFSDNNDHSSPASPTLLY